MEMTVLLARVVGPVLLLRGISLLIDRQHFLTMLDRLQEESQTVSFSLFPIAMLMTALAIVNTYEDTSSVAAILFRLIAWGMILKTSLLILFPHLVAQKAQMIGQAGFLWIVLLMSLTIGGYFTWFGYSHSLV